MRFNTRRTAGFISFGLMAALLAFVSFQSNPPMSVARIKIENDTTDVKALDNKSYGSSYDPYYIRVNFCKVDFSGSPALAQAVNNQNQRRTKWVH